MMKVREFSIEKVIQRRPTSDKYVFNFTDYRDEHLEYRERNLKFFHEYYGIEMLVVLIPSMQKKSDVWIASKMFSNWQIGRNDNSRGVLVLISLEEMRLKIEVGYGVEDVFSDLFCGHIERKQLKPYFEQNRVGDAVGTMVQEFIIRTEGKLTDTELRQRSIDSYLSGGAGIRDTVKIGDFTLKANLSDDEKQYYSAQPTPQLLLKRFAEMFKNCIDDPDLGLYTPESRIYIAYCPGMSRPMGLFMYESVTRPCEILSEGDYAVVLYLESRKSPPLFMKRSAEGWQVDIVSMVKWTIDAPNADWFIAGNAHPYMFAFRDDRYEKYVYDWDFHDNYGRFAEIDTEFEYHINRYKKYIAQNPDDPDTMIALAKIYFDVALARKSIKLLRDALKIDPNHGIANLLMALAMRDYAFLPDSALVYLRKYINLFPNDDAGWLHISIAYWRMVPEGIRYFEKAAKAMERYGELSGERKYSFKRMGYYYDCMGDYDKARHYYIKVLELDPADAYSKEALRDIEGIR
ncbi:MAG: TPM domain-containing protein [candidate division WOR-3 bacterium]|nr:MAG: TPM domain-containing protein [candidate division WOR-3 bacterium]